VVALVSSLVVCAYAVPTMVVQSTINLGTPLVVTYDITDGLDGRSLLQKSQSLTGNDWIGLFPKGKCVDVHNSQDKHKCAVHWMYVPTFHSSGQLTFEAEQYKNAGEYEARYFYGDDPTIPGAYEWVGQGWVCNYYNDSTPENNVDVRDQYTYMTGSEGDPKIAGLTLSQCQCDPTQTTQTIAACTDTLITEQSKCVSSCDWYGYGKQDTLADSTYPHALSDWTNKNQMVTNAAQCSELGLTWVTRAWGYSVTQEQCNGYRAACGRCILDAAAYSNTVTITGPAGVDTYQHMSNIPGFEIGF